MADRLGLPMQYVRKQAKGFGRNSQIEGEIKEGQRVLMVEDLTTDGGSKVNFINALRKAGARCDHTFVIFYYDIFPEGLTLLNDLGVTHHALATWWDVLAVAKTSGKFDEDQAQRGRGLHARSARLVQSPRRHRRSAGRMKEYDVIVVGARQRRLLRSARRAREGRLRAHARSRARRRIRRQQPLHRGRHARRL